VNQFQSIPIPVKKPLIMDPHTVVPHVVAVAPDGEAVDPALNAEAVALDTEVKAETVAPEAVAPDADAVTLDAEVVAPDADQVCFKRLGTSPYRTEDARLFRWVPANTHNRRKLQY
jgi:hypothetical protein